MNEFSLKIEADKLYLSIYRILMSDAENTRYRRIAAEIRLTIKRIREILENEGEDDVFTQNAIIFNMFQLMEQDFTIDPSPCDSHFVEQWSMFVCDRPEFVIIRVGTEVFDEWSLTMKFYGDKITTEYNL